MRIFEKNGKTNFVDENDVLVGFDSWQSCCERFGFFFSSNVPTTMPGYEPEGLAENRPDDLEDYSFDPNFFKAGGGDSQWDEGGMATFKVLNGSQELYLTLYNSHNGYYSHGFDVTVGGVITKTGSI